MSDDAGAGIRDYVTSHTTLTLATSGPSGPWASAVFYAVDDDLVFYFKSSPTTRHGQNLIENQKVAATIQDDGQQWASIRGIQMSGTCTLLASSDADRVDALYRRKFAFLDTIDIDGNEVNKLSKDKRQLSERLQATPWYQLRPDTIRLIDNTRGFGHRVELTLVESG